MKVIKIFQNILIGISLIILSMLPLLVAFGDEYPDLGGALFRVSFGAVFLVMLIRPLADIFKNQRWLRKLIYLRKGFGILSASIIVGFMFGHIIAPESQYITSIFTKEYWSLDDYILFAHIGDITGLILLVTSNNLSMVLLGRNWKRLQKLSYIYFFAGGIYEMLALNSLIAFIAMIIIMSITVIVFIMNMWRKNNFKIY
jgi:DMSO/TMAO reductase YedYZ heme-binding membrane subunit